MLAIPSAARPARFAESQGRVRVTLGEPIRITLGGQLLRYWAPNTFFGFCSKATQAFRRGHTCTATQK